MKRTDAMAMCNCPPIAIRTSMRLALVQVINPISPTLLYTHTLSPPSRPRRHTVTLTVTHGHSLSHRHSLPLTATHCHTLSLTVSRSLTVTHSPSHTHTAHHTHTHTHAHSYLFASSASCGARALPLGAIRELQQPLSATRTSMSSVSACTIA